MSNAQSRASNKYAAKAYDRIPVLVKKGGKKKIEEYLKNKGYKTTNSFIVDLLEKELGESLK